MKRTILPIVLILVAINVTESKGQADYVKLVEIDTLIDNVNILDSAFMVAGVKMRFPIHIVNTGTPNCKFAPAMTFVIESPDGAEWEASGLREYDLLRWEPLAGYWLPLQMSDLFNQGFYETFSYDGKGSDTVGFAGLPFLSDTGLFEGFDFRVWQLDVTPSLDSEGKTICIDYGGARADGFDEGWNALAVDASRPCDIGQVHPDWGGPYCFKILSADFSCCGRFLEGLTGNIDCDEEGRRNLADITRLIDRLYISNGVLCCSRNGNTNADWKGELNLADLTLLIDHIYISHDELELCQ